MAASSTRPASSSSSARCSTAARKNIPWGISEAAYNARDRELTYQYTNFGVPGLGLKRGLGQNTVIAPYATMLAAQFTPREAVAEPRAGCARSVRLAGTASTMRSISRRSACLRVRPTSSCRTTMPTTQGMSIAAVANVIFEGRLRDRFHSDPVIESAELLLQERAPRDIPIATVRTEADERSKDEPEDRRARTRASSRSVAGAAFDQRHVERPLLGDGDRDRLRLQPLGRACP